MAREENSGKVRPALSEPPELPAVSTSRDLLPGRLSLAIRGVGGQGNLFFGRVLTQLAFLAGYGEENIVKGETHGMAQMGGPVISTFACGKVHSPVLLPGQADCLIVMERSEMLRPGFLDMLRPGGTIVAASTILVPQGMKAEDYPELKAIHRAADGFNLIEIDVLAAAQSLGDSGGRSANVVMMGALSRISPFALIDENLWLRAVKDVTPGPAWAANYRAFLAGRELL